MTVDPLKPVWVFGTGSFGRAVASALTAHGFEVRGYAQTAPTVTEVDGRPVQPLAALPADVQLVFGIFNRETPYDSLVKTCNKAGLHKLFMPWDIYGLLSKQLGWRYWLADPALFEANQTRIDAIAKVLADEESRTTYSRIIQFRSGRDLNYASFRHDEPQYFNQLTLPSRGHFDGCYVDCGAYDGDTYVQFLSHVKNPTRAFLLEPDSNNYSKLVERTHTLKLDVTCLPLAVAEDMRTIRFSETGGESSFADKDGTVVVQAVALDQLLANQKVSFLKLDVEGGENAALVGARSIIARDRPVIAMSLYHRPNDLWALPEMLLEYCHDYLFYIRQHYFNSFDSVLYAVPRS
jgi:FkbM family methyltransferase